MLTGLNRISKQLCLGESFALLCFFVALITQAICRFERRAQYNHNIFFSEINNIFLHLAPIFFIIKKNHAYYWKNSYWIFVKSNIWYRCNYDIIRENKWCNHDKIQICQIFKMAAATILDSDLFAIDGAWHHPYLIIRGSEEL